MTKTIIGVMGPGKGATLKDITNAEELGQRIAREEWVLLTGGRNVGVMDAVSRGAKEAGGLTIGILPTEDKTEMSPHVDIPICTGMGSARNNINVLSSDVVVACGSGAGTASEVMLALKAGKPLVLLNPAPKLLSFLQELPYPDPQIAHSAAQTISTINNIL